MNHDDVKKMVEASKASVKEFSNLLNGFDALTTATLEKAPDKDKKRVEEVRALCSNAIKMAKEGNSDGINELLKKFK